MRNLYTLFVLLFMLGVPGRSAAAPPGASKDEDSKAAALRAFQKGRAHFDREGSVSVLTR